MKLMKTWMFALTLIAALASPVAVLAESPALETSGPEAIDVEASKQHAETSVILQAAPSQYGDSTIERAPAVLMDPVAQLNLRLDAQLDGTRAWCVQEGGDCLFLGTKACCPGLGCYMSESGPAAYCLSPLSNP